MLMNDLFKSLIELEFNDLFDAEVKTKKVTLNTQQSIGRMYRTGGYENGIIYTYNLDFYKISLKGKKCIIDEYYKIKNEL